MSSRGVLLILSIVFATFVTEARASLPKTDAFSLVYEIETSQGKSKQPRTEKKLEVSSIWKPLPAGMGLILLSRSIQDENGSGLEVLVLDSLHPDEVLASPKIYRRAGQPTHVSLKIKNGDLIYLDLKG